LDFSGYLIKEKCKEKALFIFREAVCHNVLGCSNGACCCFNLLVHE